jgi:starvation-inducible DNA-binding protein
MLTTKPIDPAEARVAEISQILRQLLAVVFTLYVKTRNFHWHMSGRDFHDYHLCLEEQAEQIFDMTDAIVERVRRIGGMTIRSIGDIAQYQCLQSNGEFAGPQSMLEELIADSRRLTQFLRAAYDVCGKHKDVDTARLVERWIDETEGRTWFLWEIARNRHGTCAVNVERRSLPVRIMSVASLIASSFVLRSKRVFAQAEHLPRGVGVSAQSEAA